MTSASHVASRTNSTSAHFFGVHPRTSVIDNRGVVGSSSIVKRAIANSDGRGMVALILAAIFGAITLAYMVRTFSLRRGNQSHRLSALRSALLGVQKKQIAAVLGAPRATIGRGNYLTDDIWYYPLDPKQRLALAIQFNEGVASQTQVIQNVKSSSSSSLSSSLSRS